jgi:hypothetical protein
MKSFPLPVLQSQHHFKQHLVTMLTAPTRHQNRSGPANSNTAFDIAPDGLCNAVHLNQTFGERARTHGNTNVTSAASRHLRGCEGTRAAHGCSAISLLRHLVRGTGT